MTEPGFAIIHEHHHVTDAGMRAVLETLSKGIDRYLGGVPQYLWYSPQKYRHRKDPSESFPDQYVQLMEDFELGYWSDAFDSVEPFIERVKKRKKAKRKVLDALLEQHQAIVHIIQNPTLLKNPVETQANALLAQDLLDRDYIQIWHIHDLLEEAAARRTLRDGIKTFVGEETERIYGVNGAGIGWRTSPNIFYAVINMKAQKAVQNLLLPMLEGVVFYFPDAIDGASCKAVGAPAQAGRIVDAHLGRYCSFHSAEGYTFDPDAELLIAAELARERKNTGEQLLILNMLNALQKETGRKFQLLVTMLPHTGYEKQRIEIFKAYIRINRLPVVMGFGSQIVSRGNHRQPGRFTLSDLWNHPRAFIEISTAVKEGFGLNFINPAIASAGSPYTLATVGRRLRDVFPDFEAAGMILPAQAYYDEIPVDASILRDDLVGLDRERNVLRPVEGEAKYTFLANGHCIALGRDFCSYCAGEQVLLMACIDYQKLFETMSEFVNCILDRAQMNTIAKKNAEAIKKNFSLKPYIEKLKRMIDQSFTLKQKRMSAGERPAMVRDNRKLSDYYQNRPGATR